MESNFFGKNKRTESLSVLTNKWTVQPETEYRFMTADDVRTSEDKKCWLVPNPIYSWYFWVNWTGKIGIREREGEGGGGASEGNDGRSTNRPQIPTGVGWERASKIWAQWPAVIFDIFAMRRTTAYYGDCDSW